MDVVATLGEVEACLQLVKRSGHFGKNHVSAVVEQAKTVLVVTLEMNHVRIRIRGSQVGGTNAPAVA